MTNTAATSSSSSSTTTTTTLTILTINDTYEIVPIDGVGGLAELQTILKRERQRNTFNTKPTAATTNSNNHHHTIFTVNGDFLSAGALSVHYEGKHMIDLFNLIGVDMVCLGNHEFDRGTEVTRKRIQDSNFVWVNSNIMEAASTHGNDTNDLVPLRGTEFVVVREYDGIKVGFFAVCTAETTVISSPSADTVFAPLFDSAARAIQQLEQEHHVDVIVALTHLSNEEDQALARKFPQINVIIGGHVHQPFTSFEGGTFIHKSGQNAQYLGRVDLLIEKKLKSVNASNNDNDNNKQINVFIQWQMILNRGFDADPVVAEKIQSLISDYHKHTLARHGGEGGEHHQDPSAVKLARVDAPLDSRTHKCRSSMTSFGCLLTDALASQFGASVAIVNGGFIRGDRLYEQGYEITFGDMLRELPFPRHGVMLEMTGELIYCVLEEALRTAETPSGSFPQVSRALSYTFTLQRPPGQRVLEVLFDGEPLLRNTHTKLRVVTTGYLANGGDGLVSFTKGTKIPSHSYPQLEETLIRDVVIAYVKDTLQGVINIDEDECSRRCKRIL